MGYFYLQRISYDIHFNQIKAKNQEEDTFNIYLFLCSELKLYQHFSREIMKN